MFNLFKKQENKEGEKDFNNILPFLERFKHIIPHETKIKDAVKKALEEEFLMEIPRGHIQVQGKNIRIKGSSTFKQEVSLRKHRILKRVKEIDSSVFIQEIY